MAQEGDPVSERKAILQARGISKRYGHVVALNSASVSISPSMM